jgi:hypothetical protein
MTFICVPFVGPRREFEPSEIVFQPHLGMCTDRQLRQNNRDLQQLEPLTNVTFTLVRVLGPLCSCHSPKIDKLWQPKL